MANLARVSHLYKFHAIDGTRQPVLSDVGFEVGGGEFVCIMGPSGSGKSTLLQLLSGLDEADGGSIELAGKSLADQSDRERTLLRRRTIGHVFQFFNLLPNLTVLENVALPLAIAGVRVAEQAAPVEKLLARFGLAHKHQAFPHQLSGGEMQRVSIARALAGGQPLLLCDEPTGNLDAATGETIVELFVKLAHEEDVAVVAATHSEMLAARADRVARLADGKIA